MTGREIAKMWVEDGVVRSAEFDTSRFSGTTKTGKKFVAFECHTRGWTPYFTLKVWHSEEEIETIFTKGSLEKVEDTLNFMKH